MSGLNKALIIGRVGKDPEVKQGQNGGFVASFSVATSEAWTDKATGDKKEATEWHNIVTYGKLAEIASKYVQKGGLVYVEGKIRKEDYTSKDGLPKTSFKIIANTLQLLGGKTASDQPSKNPTLPDDLNDDVPF